MNIASNISLSEYVVDAIRILILINVFKDKKSFKLTDNKVKLYDYYLKFPVTMFEEKVEKDFKKNFDEYYSFFHWKPDVIHYRRTTNYLVAKGLIVRELHDNNQFYVITEKGIELLGLLKSNYKNHLTTVSAIIAKDIVKLSDSKIEEEIRRKTNIFNRVMEVQN